MSEERKTLKTIRREYVKIARELFYPDEVIVKLNKAQNEPECCRILRTAREKSLEEEWEEST